MDKRIIAIDPGKLSGVVIQGLLGIDAYVYDKQLMYKFLSSIPPYGYPITFVVERFIHYPVQTARSGFQEIEATHIIGAIELAAHVLKAKVVYQTSSDAKTMISDDELKKNGMYEFKQFGKNAKHVRDACRHLVLYQLKLKSKENKTTNEQQS